ncbi:MAG: RsmD family RNA methyltransferase [Fibrobacteria bacterium]|nr:RsmD family RNA methyltransferase [Fibrobacteria bacterium]
MAGLVLTGGIFRSRKIERYADGRDGVTLRPTSGKVRQALFNILQNRLTGSRFLDLFAGSGSVGLEAAGRGASLVDLVECHPGIFKTLGKNVKKLSPENVRIRKSDAISFCSRAKVQNQLYDIVFADPPFTRDFSGLDKQLLPLVADKGCCVIQFPSGISPDWLSSIDNLKKYGESSLAFFYN